MPCGSNSAVVRRWIERDQILRQKPNDQDIVNVLQCSFMILVARDMQNTTPVCQGTTAVYNQT